ncbi:MAG: flippase-like domain-containing protein [Eubacteriales bacterium]|nr:flippase-like domain-containing protein [Eubacteriales bacterium]
MDKKNVRSKVIWALLFILIMWLTVKAVSTQAEDFSLSQLLDMMKDARKIPLILAFLASAGYVIFEGVALLRISAELGYKKPVHRGMLYAVADVYFSAITPSASGGQPAVLYFMKKDGIPVPVGTAALVADLVAYTIAILILGAISIIFGFKTFTEFSIFSKFLIIIGYVTLTGLAVFFILLLKRVDLLRKMADWVIKLLVKHNVIKQEEKIRNNITGILDRYSQATDIMNGRNRLTFDLVIMTLIQRASQIAVPVFLWLAICPAGMGRLALRAFFVQCFAVLGSNCMPVPGAMGVIDMLMYDGFNEFMSPATAVKFEILSRGISFYISVALSLLIVAVGYIISLIHKNRLAEN